MKEPKANFEISTTTFDALILLTEVLAELADLAGCDYVIRNRSRKVTRVTADISQLIDVLSCFLSHKSKKAHTKFPPTDDMASAFHALSYDIEELKELAKTNCRCSFYRFQRVAATVDRINECLDNIFTFAPFYIDVTSVSGSEGEKCNPYQKDFSSVIKAVKKHLRQRQRHWHRHIDPITAERIRQGTTTGIITSFNV